MGLFILNAKRSAIGKFGGSLKGVSCQEISTQIIEKMLKESNINKKQIDELIVGNVLSANQGQNIARQIIINGNFPIDCCGYTLNMVCGSGMKAILNACLSIKAKQSNCIIAGGVENMSNSPFIVNAEDIDRIQQLKKEDIISHMIKDSLTDAFSGKHMGITAENIVKLYDITREEQDEYAYNSHKKASIAMQNDIFKTEIVPIQINNESSFSEDEHIRNNCSLEKLNSLKPIFIENGTVTAGNASGINDGGSFLIISDETMIKEGFRAKAEILDFVQLGNQPEIMGMGAYLAIKKLVEKSNISFEDIDLFEINEAFAAQSLAVISELANNFKYNKEKLMTKINISGGAIALGHPLGASGARIITTLITNLKKYNLKYGIASLCIGGGMGIAILIKNI